MGGRERQCWGLGGEVGTSVWLSAAHPHPQLSPPGDPGCLGPGVLGAEGGVGSTGRAQGAHRWQRHKSVPRAGSKCQGTLSPRSGLWWLLARVISRSFSKCPGMPIPLATRNQGGTWISQLVRARWCRVAVTRISPQSDRILWSGATASLPQWGWGLCKCENIVAAPGVSEDSSGH